MNLACKNESGMGEWIGLYVWVGHALPRFHCIVWINIEEYAFWNIHSQQTEK